MSNSRNFFQLVRDRFLIIIFNVQRKKNIYLKTSTDSL